MNQSPKRKPVLIMIAMVIAIFFSCSTTKIAQDDLEKLKNLQPPPEKALVYLARPGTLGGLITFDITCDDQNIGSLPAKRFIYVMLDSGAHRFVGVAEKNSELLLRVEPGKIYYIEERAKMGIMSARNELTILTPEDGQQALKKCKLSGNCPAYQQSSK